MHLPQRVFVIGIPALVVLAIACTTADSTPFPTAAPAATSTPVPVDDDHADDGHAEDDDDHAAAPAELIDRGSAVYASAGCSACHGQGAVGTDIAPGLAGHNELQVRRQVRAPIGAMSLFDREALSSTDLDALVAYVGSLSMSEAAHEEGHDAGPATAEQSFVHHRMALTAFEADNFDEAAHHIEHLIGILDGQHLALMQQALDLVLAGDVHDAHHMVTGMLIDVLPDGDLSTVATLNMQQALAGLRVGGEEGWSHNFDHVLLSSDSPEQAESVAAIYALAKAGDIAGAEAALSELLGVQSIGVGDHDEADAVTTDEHADDGGHDEADAATTDEHDDDGDHDEADAAATDEHDEQAEPAV